jgi:tetratricopeptide (TPR) repeat protein
MGRADRLERLREQAQQAEDAFHRLGDVSLLDLAVQLRRKQLRNAHRVDPLSTAAAACSLMRVLVERFTTHATQADLTEAIRTGQEHLPKLPLATPVELRSQVLSELGNAIRQRSLTFGDPKDLSEAHRLYQTAYEIHPTAVQATNLSTTCLDAFYVDGQIANLQQALRYSTEAYRSWAPRESTAALRAHNLGLMYMESWRATRNVDHLHEAITLHRQAVQGLVRSRFLQRLGQALTDLGTHTVDPEALDEAVACHRESWRISSAGAPDRLSYLSELGETLLARYELRGDISDLREAGALFGELAGRLERGPNRVRWLARLARTHELLYYRGDTTSDVARDLYRQTVDEGQDFAPAIVRQAAHRLARLARENEAWHEVADACERGLAARDQLIRVQVHREHKEFMLFEDRDLVALAVEAHAAVGDGTSAALAAERGRAQLLSEVLDRDHVDLAELAASGRADLSERYERAASAMRMVERNETSVEQLVEAKARLDGVIEDIRSVPGWDRFLTAPTEADLRSVAADGALVYIVPTGERGVALIVEEDAPVRIVWLPGLTEDAITAELAAMEGAYHHRRAGPSGWIAAVDRITHWLWDAVMEAVTAEARADRLRIVACGPLGGLPLHAAWRGDPRRYVLDDRTVTYTPNARTLRHRETTAGHDKLLAIADPANTLPSAGAEVDAITRYFLDATVLPGAQATAQAVLVGLADVSVLHAVCHGIADTSRPLESALLLAGDDRLTVADLMAGDHSLDLAVLSACETAVPGQTLPDEMLGLPSGLLQAGSSAVIAALWAVKDRATAELMTRFYELWRAGNLHPADALRAAQRWLRDSGHHESPVYWAAFVYVGR